MEEQALPDVPTDEQVEQTLASEKVDPKDNPKVNRAAYDFMQLTKSIKEGVNRLSLKGTNRLILTMVEYPFIKTDRKLTALEQQLFMQIMAAQRANAIMREALQLSEEEIDKKVVTPITEEIKESKDVG